jgi:hypothetical protein
MVQPGREPLSGAIEVDETCIGGAKAAENADEKQRTKRLS